MNCLVSFSGGETSALMALIVLKRMRSRFDDVRVVFANTGQENEAALEFVNECDTRYGFDVVWLEACVHHGARKGSTHKVVSFETASRDGEPFEAVITKYGIPNTKYPHCTRELKLQPILSYVKRELRWAKGEYKTCVGIRADEPRRKSRSADEAGIIYPLCDEHPTTKPDVNTFWASQPFRLMLAGYQGNCKWCWKKSMRKLLTIAEETPSYFEFPLRMEHLYGLVNPPLHDDVPAAYRRTFFRENLSTEDVLYMAKATVFDSADDDSVVYSGREISLDAEPSDGCCTESCEVDFSDATE